MQNCQNQAIPVSCKDGVSCPDPMPHKKKACPVLVQYWPSTGQSTGPVLVQYWAEHWPNTGPVLVIVVVMDWSSAGENPRHAWYTRKPNHCHQKMSYGECLNVFHMLTHKPAWQGASNKAPLGILKRLVLANHKTFPKTQGSWGPKTHTL